MQRTFASRYESINEKGARDYIQAAKILTENSGPRGPIDFCWGLTIEIALKLCLKKQEVPENDWAPKAHDLVFLKRLVHGLELNDVQQRALRQLNANYYKNDAGVHTSRYRPSRGRCYVAPGQEVVEELLEFILAYGNSK